MSQPCPCGKCGRPADKHIPVRIPRQRGPKEQQR